jgi:hypothetical protein
MHKGGSFFISINRAVCCKIQCNKFCSLRCHSGLHRHSKLYLDPDYGVSAIMMNMYQNMGNLLALQWYLGFDAHILHNLVANRGCHRAERLDIIMAETFK